MILVDTSVLIAYLKGEENKKTAMFQKIVDTGMIYGINELIYLELLQGCKSEKEFRLLKKYLDTQRFYYLKNERESYVQAAKIFYLLRRRGITVASTIDCLIAQTAIENQLFMLHNDLDFAHIAKVVPLKEYG